MIEERVFVAGSGPAGLSAAACLARRGIPVTVFEAMDDLSAESRASTFHPPTLDMLHDLGVAEGLIEQGLVAPTLQYRSKAEGLIAKFDFAAISDLTAFPYRLQCEQFKLTRLIKDHYASNANLKIEFGSRIESCSQTQNGVELQIARPDGSVKTRQGLWLIGADGARSNVRRSLGIEFEGFTWAERFLVISTTYDFDALIPDLSSVSYVADPIQWHFLLRVPGVWRVMFPISPDVTDEVASGQAFAEATLATILPKGDMAQITHTTLYRVHQRVAKTFRQGRAFLVGDAAHINNPLGGMGMNGGIHDALNLTNRLVDVWNDKIQMDELDRYDLQRRLVTLEYVQKQTIENKKNLEAQTPEDQAAFRMRMRAAAADPAEGRAYLKRVSMIASLERAAELG